jgi:hypothetical protein
MKNDKKGEEDRGRWGIIELNTGTLLAVSRPCSSTFAPTPAAGDAGLVGTRTWRDVVGLRPSVIERLWKLG